MTTLPRIGFENKILCEEIRQEKSNKYILIGVYSGDILLNTFPAHIPLSLYIETLVVSRGENRFWLRLSGPGDGEFTLALKTTTDEDNQTAHIVTPRLEVLMECEGTLKIEVSGDEVTWQPLIQKQVIQADGIWSLPPIAVSPLSEQSSSDAQDSSSPPEPSRRGSRKRHS